MLSCKLTATVCYSSDAADAAAYLLYVSVSFEDVLLAGVVTLKPWDNNQRWKTLDRSANYMLEFLLHESPERRLNATTLLHNPWLCSSVVASRRRNTQGRPFPSNRILGLRVS